MRKLIAILFVTALLLSPHTSIFTARADSSRARGTIRAVDLRAQPVSLYNLSDDVIRATMQYERRHRSEPR